MPGFPMKDAGIPKNRGQSPALQLPGSATSWLRGGKPEKILNEFEAGEEVADFECGSFRGVGAVGAIVTDGSSEVVANGSGCGFFGIGGAHSVAPFENGAVGFENHGDNLAGAHEVGEFAEEGALFVNGVKAAGFFFGEAHGFDGDDFETGAVNAREDFALLAASDGVGLDDCESAFYGHLGS
jgi:hypothetical protein